MGSVVADISMSLDGFVTAPGADLEHGLGVGGEPLHAWAWDGKSQADAAVLDSAVAATGVIVMGRRLFDFVDGPHGWHGDVGYGGERDQGSVPPVFVVTHHVPEAVRLEPAFTFTFVTDGIVSDNERARPAAGDKDVVVMGGANVVEQSVAAGLVDEIRIHLAPVLLGGGTRLFEPDGTKATLEPIKVVDTPRATHLYYRVVTKP